MNNINLPTFQPNTLSLYVQNRDSHPISNTIVEDSLFEDSYKDGIILPANSINVGEVYNIFIQGVVSCQTAMHLGLQLLLNSKPILSTTFTIDPCDNSIFTLNIISVVRATGIETVGNIISTGTFSYYPKDIIFQEGVIFTENNMTNVDTTIENTLNVTAMWDNDVTATSIYSTIANITKTKLS